MTVAFLAHQQGAGGIGRFVRELAAELPEAARAQGVELSLLGAPKSDSIIPGGVKRVVHEQFVVPRANRAAGLLHLPDHRPILAARTRFILTVHDVFFLDHPEWFPPAQRVYKRLLLNAALLKRPFRIVCVSQFTKERLLHHAPRIDRSIVRVVHPGVRQPERALEGGVSRLERDENHGLTTSDGYFLTVSTIEPRKNFEGALKAFRTLRSQGFPLRWKIAGGLGYQSAGIVESLRAVDGVDVLGSVSEEALDALYDRALFVLSPSHAEGFGFPPLEAMARGVPCVCSLGSAYDEVVGNAAVQAEPDDDVSWSRHIQRVGMDAELRADMAARGVERAKRFSWQVCAREHVDLYLEADCR